MAKAVKPLAAKSSRSYDSSRRQEQARETERAVLRAASELFVGRGYARTTLADVASHAGVSVETIYSRFRNKPGLLHRVWDVTIGGDDEEVVFHERPEIVAMRQEPDLAKRLALHAALMTQTAHRIAPFMLMLQGAADAEPAAKEMLEEIGRQRLAGMTVMAMAAAETGQLAVSMEDCRDFVWALTDGMLWHRLVEERGWSDERFTQHLAAILVSTLVR